MKISYIVRPLVRKRDWARLTVELGDNSLDVVQNTVRHLRVLDPKSYVVETPYIDRDYSADYAYFYSRTFRAHERYCKRIHFFSKDIAPVLDGPTSTEQLERIKDFTRTTYCGFTVIRPLAKAPIGRTVLKGLLRDEFDIEATVTCRAHFNAHILGVRLRVTGTAFLQQDSRVGACAQVAIWVGMRHMHARHNYNWVSVSDITRFAQPATAREAVSLPVASALLESNSMVRAIIEGGYQPLCFRQVDFRESILPYVESGIPVILGLNLNGSGHAVTVIGRVFAKQKQPTNEAANYIPAYIVHDDQGGPYRWLPTEPHSSREFSFTEDTIKRDPGTGIVELNVREHAVFAVALMSPRVFSTAKAAEHSAWDRINDVLRNMGNMRRLLQEHQLPVNDELLDELESAYKADQIVLRTYLTSAAGYRRHLAEGSASDNLKGALLDLHLPHFTWITEISTVGSYNQFSPRLRTIYGHTILDATSTGERGDGLLVLHLPGLLFTSDVTARRVREDLTIIHNDRLYECREKRLSR